MLALALWKWEPLHKKLSFSADLVIFNSRNLSWKTWFLCSGPWLFLAVYSKENAEIKIKQLNIIRLFKITNVFIWKCTFAVSLQKTMIILTSGNLHIPLRLAESIHEWIRFFLSNKLNLNVCPGRKMYEEEFRNFY